MALRVHPLIAIGLILCAFLASTRALTQDEKDFIVEKHNEYRREERTSLPDLVWDESLAKEAQAWANSCNDWHQEQDWGENIGYDDNISTETYSEALEKTLKIWMDEGDLNRDGSFRCCSATEQDCCNYSQIVWKRTKKVGCGFNRCPNMNNGIYVVCYYTPPGNKLCEKAY